MANFYNGAFVGKIAAAAALALASAYAMGQADGPLKIGVPTALSGPSAGVGNEAKRAVEFAAAEANARGGVAGRKVDVKVLDTEAKADNARRLAERLTLEGYKVLVAASSSGESLALAPMLDKWDAIYIATVAKSDKLTGDSCHRRMFRVNKADSQDNIIIKPWLANQKSSKWAILGTDTVWGRGVGAAFTEAAKSTNKTIVGEYYPALGTNDYAPYIQQIKTSGAEGLWVGLIIGDAINFTNQGKQFGLIDSIQVAGVNYIIDTTVKSTGSAAKGLWGIINYSASIDTPENRRFVEAWKKANKGDEPSNYEGETYVGMQVIFQAVERAKSVKPVDIAKAIKGGTFDTILGKITIRAEDHQALMPNYFGEVSEVNGKMRPVVRTVIPADQATPAPSGACKMAEL